MDAGLETGQACRCPSRFSGAPPRPLPISLLSGRAPCIFNQPQSDDNVWCSWDACPVQSAALGALEQMQQVVSGIPAHPLRPGGYVLGVRAPHILQGKEE